MGIKEVTVKLWKAATSFPPPMETLKKRKTTTETVRSKFVRTLENSQNIYTSQANAESSEM